LEGRVKLAKLDFLLRYAKHLGRVLESHGVARSETAGLDLNDAPLDSRMMRYRYGPWDPAYYAILGALIGRGLVEVAPLGSRTGFGYRTSLVGEEVAARLRADESFSELSMRIILIRRHLDKSGTVLKNYLYELPEISEATWHEELA
jgi:hypothetical protein